MFNKIPEDIKSSWLNVLRRLQSVSRSEGLAIISITILVDQNANPVFWTEPKRTLIEPKKSVENIIKLLLEKQDTEDTN